MKSSTQNYTLHRKRRNKSHGPIGPEFNENLKLEKLKPFLKWAGGKTQLLDDIIPRIPKNINNYMEPFIGAGSVLIAILSQLEKNTISISGNIRVSDINPYLIACYQVISDAKDCKQLLIKLKKYEQNYLNSPIPPKKEKGFRRSRNAPVSNSFTEAVEQNQEEVYYYLRSEFIKLQQHFNEYKKNILEDKNKETGMEYSNMLLDNIYTPEQKIEVAVLMIFLNKTCWRGLYRESKKGLINVPFGNYYTVTICDCDLFQSLHRLFGKYKVEFILSDFTWCKKAVVKDDFIYFDPPYYPEDEGTFINYQADGFNLEKNLQLVECCHHIHQQDAKFLISNSQTQFVKEKYQVYIKIGDILVAKRSINSKKPGGFTGEYLISNY